MNCRVDGCERMVRSLGLCSMHYLRQRKGVPLDRPWDKSSSTRLCAVTDCQKPAIGRGLCTTHYTRLMKHGDTDTVLKKKPSGRVTILGPGYRMKSMRDHPLAGSAGQVLEHRAVLYDAIGLGPHRCHHCGRHVNWRMPLPDRLETDHLDWDVSNNERSNLVQSCIQCNSHRHRRISA